jgi:hypothetical protein
MDNQPRTLYDPSRANHELRRKINNEMAVSRDKGIIAAYEYMTQSRQNKYYQEEESKKQGFLASMWRNLHFVLVAALIFAIYVM